MTSDPGQLVPELRTDFVRRELDGGSIVWSPIAAEPFAVDPVASVMLDVVDGEASIDELAAEVSEEVGVPLDAAQRQVQRIIDLFGSAGLLTTSESATTAAEAISRRQIFPSGSTPCSENEARLGTVVLHLRLGPAPCASRATPAGLLAHCAPHWRSTSSIPQTTTPLASS